MLDYPIKRFYMDAVCFAVRSDTILSMVSFFGGLGLKKGITL